MLTAMEGENDDLYAILEAAGMGPDHRLFARAQEALKKQQEAQKLGLVEQTREKSSELQARSACSHGCRRSLGYSFLCAVNKIHERHLRRHSMCRSFTRRSVRTLAWSSTTSSSSSPSCR